MTAAGINYIVCMYDSAAVFRDYDRIRWIHTGGAVGLHGNTFIYYE